MATSPLTIYYQVDRKRLVDASGNELQPNYYPAFFLMANQAVSLHLTNSDATAVGLPSSVVWNLDIDTDYNANTAPVVHVTSESITVSESAVFTFNANCATSELKAKLAGKSQLLAVAMLRAYALETIGGVETEVTKFAVVFPVTLRSLVNVSGALPSSIGLTQDLVDFLDPYFGGGSEADPVFAAWLETDPLSGFLTSESDPSFTAWLETNPLSGFISEETDPVFAEWLATNPLSGFISEETDPVFTAWLEGGPLADFVTKTSFSEIDNLSDVASLADVIARINTLQGILKGV